MAIKQGIRLRDVELGDVVFVKAENTSLGTMITRLDHSPYSHAAIVYKKGKKLWFAGARTHPTNLLAFPYVDSGGVRLNTLQAFLKRGIAIARPTDPALVGPALKKMTPWIERQKYDDNSRFSYVKLFVVAAALQSLWEETPGSTNMLHASVDAAQAFPWDLGQPNFYSAEMVAAAYSKSFTMGEFQARTGPPPDGAMYAAAPAMVVLGRLFRDTARLAERLKNELANRAQLEAMWHLLTITKQVDASFLKEALQQLESLLTGVDGPPMPPTPAPSRRVKTSPAMVVPTALVTPRMLMHADWLEFLGPVTP